MWTTGACRPVFKSLLRRCRPHNALNPRHKRPHLRVQCRRINITATATRRHNAQQRRHAEHRPIGMSRLQRTARIAGTRIAMHRPRAGAQLRRVVRPVRRARIERLRIRAIAFGRRVQIEIDLHQCVAAIAVGRGFAPAGRNGIRHLQQQVLGNGRQTDGSDVVLEANGLRHSDQSDVVVDVRFGAVIGMRNKGGNVEDFRAIIGLINAAQRVRPQADLAGISAVAWMRWMDGEYSV